MKYAQKINFRPNLKDLRWATVLLEKHATPTSGEDNALLTRYCIPTRLEKTIDTALPEVLRNKKHHMFRTVINTAALNTELLPHIHTDDTCVINLYTQTSGEETSFYEGIVQIDDDLTTDNGNKYKMVKYDSLKKVESFIANAGDTWVLNTRQPHKVDGHQEKLRDMVQIYFMDTPFEEVIKCFKEDN